MAEPEETDSTEERGLHGLRGTPITNALIALNVGVFAAQVALGGSIRYAFGGTNEAEQRVWSALLRWLGANDAVFTIGDSRLETLVTSCFLHGSLLHLGFNMIALWQVGPFLEKAIGRARYFPLYVGSGIVASAASAIWGRFFGAGVSVGASGAICGLIGAALVLGVRTQGWKGPLTLGMARWLGVLLLIGLARNLRRDIVQIDNAAHVGGTLAGVVLAASWRRGLTYAVRAQRIIVGGCVAVLVAAAATVFVRDRTDPYLFLDVEGRLQAAWNAAAHGHCDEAAVALMRAKRMDPNNLAIHDLEASIDRQCLAGGAKPPATPR